ncbi:hypothetical protein B0H11DRAFT_2242303 [Mycena galericulata]|nr:hypothetical protein B0H11DRAFT_2242303 [Mycena galericulata]
MSNHPRDPHVEGPQKSPKALRPTWARSSGLLRGDPAHSKKCLELAIYAYDDPQVTARTSPRAGQHLSPQWDVPCRNSRALISPLPPFKHIAFLPKFSGSVISLWRIYLSPAVSVILYDPPQSMQAGMDGRCEARFLAPGIEQAGLRTPVVLDHLRPRCAGHTCTQSRLGPLGGVWFTVIVEAADMDVKVPGACRLRLTEAGCLSIYMYLALIDSDSEALGALGAGGFALRGAGLQVADGAAEDGACLEK